MPMAVVQAWPKGGFEADMALERIQSGHLECTLSKIIRWCNYERTDYYNRSSSLAAADVK